MNGKRKMEHQEYSMCRNVEDVKSLTVEKISKISVLGLMIYFYKLYIIAKMVKKKIKITI